MQTRDQKINEEIGEAEDVVAKLVRTLGGLVVHAASEGAVGHAGLYDAVQAHLSAAEKDLRRAYSVMLNGEPDDYLE